MKRYHHYQLWYALMLFILALFYPFASPFAQGRSDGKSTMRTAPNTQYEKAGKFKRLLLGHHYRKEWATVVVFPVLDADSAGGGLAPIRLGGGMQTKSLRLKGADGKEYVLRSVNKDPSKALPPEMAGTFANDVLQDQISSSNPYAPLAVASLAASAGIFHTNPRMVYVPHTPRLGKFEQEFAATICLFEERPSDSEEDNPAFGYARHIVNSEKLFDKLQKANDHRVDEKAFLKARLFDMWIGDWDRHSDQWLWAGFTTGTHTLYKPIPRDRDQAFSKLDGIIPQAASRRWALRKTQDFDYTIRDIDGLNMAGHFLDRHFTTGLGREDWMEVCHELQKSITDSAIDAAFQHMPAEVAAISGPAIIAKLKKRRADLEYYAAHYYRFLSKEVNVAGSEKQEVFEVSSENAGSTRVTVFATDNNGHRGDTVYNRLFFRGETKEIRLYGIGGNDVFIVNGTDKGMLVRIIRGEESRVVDSTGIKNAPAGIKLYDSSFNGLYKRESFRYDWFSPLLSPGYNPDDGLYIGGGIVFKKQQFGKYPYGYSQSIRANYAFATGAYNFWYAGDFRELAGKWDLHINARINAPNYVRNYYGLGNETVRIDSTRNYYNIRSNQFIVSPSLYRALGKRHSLEAGISYQSIKMERTEGRFVSGAASKLDSTDFERNNYFSPFLQYQYSTLDDILYPHKGIKITTGIAYLQNTGQSKGFLKLGYESAVYLSKGVWTGAVRTGVSANLGDDYAFFQANTLGGTDNLRGFRRDRFAGKTSMYNNAEIRYRFSYFRGYIFRGSYGLLSFFDNGRVWVPGESVHNWHYGYGGGIWFLPYNKMAFTATYGISKEDRIVSIKAGFLF